MKILLTTHRFFPDVGGIETASEVFSRCFYQAGHELIVATTSTGDQVLDARMFPFTILRRASTIKLLKVYRWADIIFQNNVELGSLWPILLVNKPYIICTQTWIRSVSGSVRLVDRLKRYMIRHANASICISESVKQDTYEHSSVIGNPYDSNLFHSLPNTQRSKALVFVGRLVSDKGVDILIDAFFRLVDCSLVATNEHGSNIDLCLTIVGDGPEAHNLRKLVAKYGLSSSVRFMGTLTGEDLVKELNKHVILVVPSRWAEPFGIVALEGAACGCVVIGSDAGGLPDAIGPAGLTFRSGDAGHLAEVLRKVLTSTGIQLQLRNNAKHHLSMHTSEHVSNKYLAIMRKAVEGHR